MATRGRVSCRKTSVRFRQGRVSPRIPAAMGMRIFHVVESSVPEAGSVSVLVQGLLGALRNKGIESHAVSLNGSSPEENTASSDVWHQLDGAGDETAIGTIVSDASLVHFHGWGHPKARRLAIAMRKAGKPYVISPLGCLSYGPYRKRSWSDRLVGPFRHKPLIRAAAALTTGNEREAEDLLRRRVNAKIQRLPYGIDLADYDEKSDAQPVAPDPSGVRWVLMLGPVHPVEGLIPLLKSLYELGPFSEGWSVVFAGREVGDWRRMLEPAIVRKGGQDRVRFVEAADVKTQRRWLRKASLLAAPSLHTRCPVSAMQAVAAGVPVVASAHSAPLGLEDEMWVFGTTRAELKITLRKILELSDEQRTAMAQRARDAVRSRFDWSVLSDDYVQFYRNLV